MACFGGDDKKLFSINEEYGEKYEFDVNFKGPKTGRLATDVHWLWVFLVFSTAWIIFGICVLTTGLNNIDQDMLRAYDVTYLKETLWCYLGPILIAAVICLIFCYAIRWIAAPAVWFSLFVIIALFVCVSIGGFMQYNTSDDDDDYIGLVIGILFMIMTAVIVSYIYSQRKHVFVAIALIKEGSKAVASSYSTVFLPIIPTFFHFAFFALFASVLVNISLVSSPDNSGIEFVMDMLNFFGFLWICWFLEGFQTMVLAHTYSAWYWTLDKDKLPFYTLTAAIRTTTHYHLGSIALGSMILAIGQVICNFIKTLMDNRCMRMVNICCNINEIVQRLLHFLSKNAFIMVTIHGDPFCKSMRDAFNLLMRNIHSVFVTNRITKLLFGIFNLLIAVGTGVLTYTLLPKDDVNRPNDDILFYVAIAISVYGSLIVGITFFGVYITAVDTLFLCFLEDRERNDGTEEKPYHMSPELMKLLHKNAEIAPPLQPV